LVESNSIYVGNDPSSTSDNASYNIAVGTTALDAITTGDNNVALGYDALTANTTGYENSASGVESLYNNISGRSNTAMGYRSLRANTSGGYNTASGVESMYSNTTGQFNLALGVKSLRKNTTASYNTALGYAALYDANRTADANAYNTALGYNAGNTGTNDITTGDKNVLLGASTAASQAAASNQIVIGYGATGAADNTVQLGNTSITNVKTSGTITAGAITIPNTDGSANQVLQTDGSGTLSWATASGGASSVTGLTDGLVEDNSLYIGNDPSSTTSSAQYNVAVGTTALDAITTGDYNVALGHDVLTDNTTGGHNTASGYRSLQNNTTGWGNTTSGMQTLSFNTEGYGNVAIGYNSMLGNTEANYNTAIGYHSLYNTYSNSGADTYNVGVGFKAGDLISTGTNNVILGASADPSANSATNQIVIGYGATGTGDNSVSLGNTSISSIKGQVAFSTYSDMRIKKNIVDNDLGLAFINKLHTVKYNLKNPADYPEALLEERFKTGDASRPTDNTKMQDGLIAQDVKTVLDELGVEWSGWSENDSNGKQSIQYGALTVPLIKAIQEQQAQIEALQNQLQVLVAMQTQDGNTVESTEGDQ